MLGLFGAAGTACDPDTDAPECSGEPSFVITVTAADGALPDDLRLEVRYGGSGEPEVYRLAHPHEPEVVFCSPEDEAAAVGGSGGATHDPQSLTCRLWTEGPASVTARAAGYPPVLLELQTEDDLCTVADGIELMRGDGGAPGD